MKRVMIEVVEFNNDDEIIEHKVYDISQAVINTETKHDLIKRDDIPGSPYNVNPEGNINITVNGKLIASYEK